MALNIVEVTGTKKSNGGKCGYTRDEALEKVRTMQAETGRRFDIGYTGPAHHASGLYATMQGSLLRFCKGVIGDKDQFASEV